MNTYTSIIIEDEPYHLELLRLILKKNCPYIEIKEEVNNICDAKTILSEKSFDIVFLDVNLGNDCAFELLESLPVTTNSEIIITTSHKKHALDAFRHLVTDYVLKPIALESVIQAVNRSISNIETKRLAAKHTISEQQYEKPLKVLAVSSINEVKIIPVDDILYLQSEGKYTIFYCKNSEQIVSSKNLGHYEKLLANNNFFRIHHSYLVNMNYAINVQKKDGNYLEVYNHQYLPISKRKVDSFYQYLGVK